MSASLRILNETTIDRDEVGRLLGTTANPVHSSTVLRAMNRGCKTASGERVYLEHLHTGGKIITSREAVERYLAKLNGIDLGAVEAGSTSAPSKQRVKELARVDAKLTAAGI
jgi:hypothetical protein